MNQREVENLELVKKILEDEQTEDDPDFQSEASEFDQDMWKKFITVHSDLSILESFFWKNTEKFFIEDMTRLMRSLLEHLEDLDRIIPFIDVYYKHYINKFLVFTTSQLRSSQKQLETWTKKLEKYKTSIYLREVGTNIFEFIKLMDDEEINGNLVAILKEIKDFASTGDVRLCDPDRRDMPETQGKGRGAAAFRRLDNRGDSDLLLLHSEDVEHNRQRHVVLQRDHHPSQTVPHKEARCDKSHHLFLEEFVGRE